MRWCDSAPCKNGGKCWQTNVLYRCECHSGWTGLYCDVPSVSCEAAARQRGNRVSAQPGFPAAVPREGSPGLTRLPAAVSPAGVDVTRLCRNGGLCMDAGSTHHCRCQPGYTGSYCEDQVDECSPSPCQNGATCTDYPGGYSCEVGTRSREGAWCVTGCSAPGWEPAQEGRLSSADTDTFQFVKGEPG